MSEENKDRIIQDFATNLIRLGNECRDHALENARLKAEVERLRIAGSESEPRFVLLSDYRHLKAEVERLQSIHSIDSIGIEQLKAQVERLTKAGDAMMGWIDYQPVGSGYQHSRAWEAAKHKAKGVQS
jgi:hypothetical protein